MKNIFLTLLLALTSVQAIAQKKASETGYDARQWVIGGNFDNWQRGTSLAAISVGYDQYLADRFAYGSDTSAGSAVTISRSTDVPTFSQSKVVSRYSYLLTVTTAKTPSVGDSAFVDTRIEGSNYAYLHGKPIVLSFWVKSSVTGTYYVAFLNSKNTATSRAYLAPYTVNALSTWEKKTIAITTDTVGTWAFDSTIGMVIRWNLAAGNTTAVAGSWQSNVPTSNSSSGQVNFLGTLGATWRLSQVMLNVGDRAAPFALAGGTIGGELALAKRYYNKLNYLSAPCYALSGTVYGCSVIGSMRAQPGLSYSALSGFAVAVHPSSQLAPTAMAIYNYTDPTTMISVTTAAGTGYVGVLMPTGGSSWIALDAEL